MARFLRQLADEEYPTATIIVLVMENLGIHEAFHRPKLIGSLDGSRFTTPRDAEAG